MFHSFRQIRITSIRNFNSNAMNVSLSGNCKITCVMFDINVLIGDEPLTSQPSKQQLDKEKEEQYQQQQSLLKSSPTQSFNKDNIASNTKSKYMNKLRARVGDAAASVISPSELPAAAGDGKLLSKAKEMSGGMVSTPSRWLLQSGMGDMLDYIHKRTIKLVVVPRTTTPKTTVSALLQQLESTKINVVPVEASWLTEPDLDKGLTDSFKTMITKTLKCELSQTLIVSNTTKFDKVLQVGKSLGCYTCRYRALSGNGLFGNVSADFLSHSPIEIQDALEELNGVAFRSSAFDSRQYR